MNPLPLFHGWEIDLKNQQWKCINYEKFGERYETQSFICEEGRARLELWKKSRMSNSRLKRYEKNEQR